MPINPFNDQLNRREFVMRLAKAGLSIGAACGLGYGFYEAAAPHLFAVADNDVRVPNFALEQSRPKMAVVRGADRRATIQLALKAIGGIEHFVKRGDRVVVKVNAAFASPPMIGATSHPDLVAEVCGLCFQAGASSVVVIDNPINDPSSCFAFSGIADAAQGAGAKVRIAEKQDFKPLTLPDGRLIKNWPVFYTPLKDANKLIGLAPLKDHHRSGASMTLKNWYGLLGGRRNIFHQDIHNIIKELALMVRPTLVVLDGTVAMMTNGPTGGSLADLKDTRTMIASTDPVAADAFGATLLSRTAADLPYIAKAEAAGAGTADWQALVTEILHQS